MKTPGHRKLQCLLQCLLQCMLHRLWVGAFVGCMSTVLLTAGDAGAQPAPEAQTHDYAPANTSWTGLSDFVAMADNTGDNLDLKLNVGGPLDWSTLSRDDVLLVVHPLKALDLDNATRFIADGGRMLIAIEPGGEDSFLARLGLRYVDMGPEQIVGGRFVRDNPALPIFTPTGTHPLLTDVHTLVANHPAVLINVGGPVVAYPDGTGLIYDMNLGDGKVVVFGDASMLINQMLHVADNALLARNALQYLCAGRQPCEARLLTSAFDQFGSFDVTDAPDETTADAWSRWLAGLNATLRSFMNDLPATRLLYYLAIMLAVGLALYLAAVFRLRAGRPYSEHIRRTNRDLPTPQSEYDWNLARFGGGGRETNFALPLAILKEVFEELFLDALGFWPISKDQRPTVAELGRAFRRRYLVGESDADRVERQVVDLLATYAAIPTRHRVFLDSDAYFSERDLIKIYRSTRDVLRLMGLEEAYEQRTRSLV